MRHFIALIFIVFSLVGCEQDPEVNHALINRIPTDSKIIIRTDNLKDLDQVFSSNELFENLSSLSRIQEIKKASAFLRDYNLTDDSLIALSIEGKNEVVITLITTPVDKVIDSTKATKVISYNKVEIIERQKDKIPYYSINHKGVHLASSSQLVIESLVRRDVSKYLFDDGFEDIYKRTKSGNTIYVKATEKKWLEQFIIGNNINDNGNHAQWYQLEAQTGDDIALQLDGVITYKDSLKMDHDLYNNIDAAQNQIQEVVPVNFLNLKAVTYKKPSQLIDNLRRYHSKDVRIGSQLLEILDNTQEMSEVVLDKSNALVFTLKPYEAIFMNLDSLSTAKFTYRDHMVYELSQPVSTSALQPLVQSKSYKFVTILDQHLIFSNSSTTSEEFISNYQNKTVLAEQSWWQPVSDALSSSSSLLKITSTKELKEQAQTAATTDLKIIKKINENDFPLLISQFVHQDEYAHYHMIIPAVGNSNIELKVSQLGTYKSPNKIIAGPFLFFNHISKRHDVAFQDEDFTLHLLSETGKKWWSKKLDGVILGEIEATDAYKNGRNQMAFATSTSVYFLDRNGKDVNTYPKRFKNTITQPLSVFDYDNRREYRFLVTQGKELTMLDRDGKTIKGFNYKKNSEITTQPKHFRLGVKDYIAFAKADKTIALLSRTGKIRTKVKEEIDLKSDLYFHNNKVVAMTKVGKLMQLDLMTGSIKYLETFGSESIINANEKLMVVQYNNDLTINGNKVTLPYGTYLPAQVTHLKSGDFIHLIENGEHQVYILNKNGEVVSNLPVYGKSVSKLSQSHNRYLSTLDGDDVIIYKW
ncbi:MAG: hypothetical protein ABF274_12995 [Nonlabens sp.]|uniref:hypothetical protein n=1 Tax=Nonlabens sp. TaxID=1888209 RepID=UPI003218F209